MKRIRVTLAWKKVEVGKKKEEKALLFIFLFNFSEQWNGTTYHFAYGLVSGLASSLSF